MKNPCIKAITAGKGEMTVNLCRMIGKCENKDCRCEYPRRLKGQNEEEKSKVLMLENGLCIAT